MEEEVRRILTRAVSPDQTEDLAALFLETFGPKHGVELEIPERSEMPRDVNFR
jgi:plasmid stability protein